MAEQTQATVSKKISTTVGAYIALMHAGKLLLIRRERKDSIIPGQSFYGNWELPGGAVEEGDEGKSGYSGVVRAALRKFMEKTGVNLEEPGSECPFSLSSRGIGIVYPFLFKQPTSCDLALLLSVNAEEEQFNALQGENFKWVDLTEFNELADDSISETEAVKAGSSFAQGLLGGKGKRQHCMGLTAFAEHDEDEDDADQAEKAHACLEEITATWK